MKATQGKGQSAAKDKEKEKKKEAKDAKGYPTSTSDEQKGEARPREAPAKDLSAPKGELIIRLDISKGFLLLGAVNVLCAALWAYQC